MAKAKKKAKGSTAATAEAAVVSVLAKRAELDQELGGALSLFVASVPPPHTGRPPIVVPAQGSVAVRMHKQGVTYVFALNKAPLPYAENGYYQLHLNPGMNGLVWYVRPTKDTWAFQVDLIANGHVLALDRHSSSDSPKPASVLEQQPLDAR